MIRKDQIFFILDYETTGVDPKTDYPIEVGVVITDSNFNVLKTYESLIRWEEIVADQDGKEDWISRWSMAYNYHNISVKEYLEGCKHVDEVVTDLQLISAKYSMCKDGTKPILLSDNIQFEYNFTKKMFGHVQAPWPFHYCGWDTSLLLESTSVGDPDIVEHRALSDASGLHRHIIRALEENGYWNK